MIVLLVNIIWPDLYPALYRDRRRELLAACQAIANNDLGPKYAQFVVVET